MKNILYNNPALYEAIYPDTEFSRGSMCLVQFLRHLGKYPNSVLDIGCGTGRDIEFLSRHGIACCGVDPSPDMITYASARTDAEFQLGDIQSLSLARSFDAILVLGNVLSHLTNPGDLACGLETIARHSHPGTLLIVSIFNYGALMADGITKHPQKFSAGPGLEELQGTAIYRCDHRNQLLHRKRTWHRHNEEIAVEKTIYRMIFVEELQQLFRGIGYKTLDLADNESFCLSDFAADEITLVGQFCGPNALNDC